MYWKLKILGGNIFTRPQREVRTVRYMYLQKKSCNHVLKPTTVRPVFLLGDIFNNLQFVLFSQRNLNKNETKLFQRRSEVKQRLQSKNLSPLCFRTALFWFYCSKCFILFSKDFKATSWNPLDKVFKSSHFYSLSWAPHLFFLIPSGDGQVPEKLKIFVIIPSLLHHQ
jgi:hypothetical protein